jgi:HK97 family phage prohead protease
MDLERRVISSTIELRSGGGGSTLIGYAAVFNSLSGDLGGFREVIKPGAFDRSLASGTNVMARAEHDSKLLLGTTAARTLRLSVDGRGLRYEVDVPDTTAGRDVLTLVRRGDLAKSSFAFYTPKGGDKWPPQADGSIVRELHSVELVDVAPVAVPAYEATTVSARALGRVSAKGGVPLEILIQGWLLRMREDIDLRMGY